MRGEGGLEQAYRLCAFVMFFFIYGGWLHGEMPHGVGGITLLFVAARGREVVRVAGML